MVAEADESDGSFLRLTPTMAVPAFPIGQQPETIAGRAVHPFWGYLPFTFPDRDRLVHRPVILEVTTGAEQRSHVGIDLQRRARARIY